MTDLLYPHTVISTQASSAFEELGAAATEMPTMTTTMMMEEEEEDPYARFRFYEDGEEMTQIWNASFVVFAYLLSCVGSYSAVHLLDHGLWRRGLDKTQLENNKIMIRYPELYAACLLGFGSVWCMHFVGMSAVSLEGAPVCFNWSITIGSLAAVVVLMIAGIFVAGNDIFATSKREQILSEILGNKFMTDREAMWAMTRVICFHKLHFLFAGSFLAASGAIVMHYTGMMAQRGPFRTEWDAGYVAASIASGIVICFVGFWIIFRLRWKIQQFWLRYVSAAVISAAFCFLHFFGMLGVTYHADNNKLDSCKSTWEMDETSPSAWTTHQRIIIALAIIVPSISLYIENLISQELILAYDVQEKENPNNLRNELFADGKSKLQTFLKDTAMPEDEDGDEEDLFNEQGQLLRAEKERRKPGNSKPIADLFTSTTIMVANLTGFTSWSSMREPSQVFMLLEAVYETFDKILRRFESVAKAEVTGDSYVAVAGLLDNARNKDHAIIMCRVAREMQQKITILTQKLEVVLGPDTGDVGVRIGLHSGPVTAGILRGGDRKRFQLFGPTMNAAYRIESRGEPQKILVSDDTAELLKAGGKTNWTAPREDEIFIKGKGNIRCHWLKTKGGSGCSSSTEYTTSVASSSKFHDHDESSSTYSQILSAGDEYYRLKSEKTERLIAFNTENLARLLREIVARRAGRVKKEAAPVKDQAQSIGTDGKTLPIDEVAEIIDLPEFSTRQQQKNPDSIILPYEVMQQLRDYVRSLASMYHNNPFHNFEHASHVSMSVAKLLSRIVDYNSSEDKDENKSVALTLHENTFGITTDPLTQFSCILSALIHDVDHQGVPNSQLIKEGADIASIYKQSVAEQNSVDLAWKHLMDDKYKELRSTIYATEEERKRFRQLVVNSVMATDIMDKDLKNLRNNRWDKAFRKGDYASHKERNPQDEVNRKATIVIEHLLQASDVSHTMQHWHIYKKWNASLFEEMYKAWKEGRADKNPVEFWYKGEIGFFDFYIIPLAKKLKDCGVFGVSSDEFLNYAITNRREWEENGAQVVKELIEKVNSVWAEIEANQDGSTKELSAGSSASD